MRFKRFFQLFDFTQSVIPRYAALLSLLSLTSGLQFANADEQNVFFGISYSAQFYTHDDLSATYIPSVALVRLGVDVNKYLGFETRFGVGVSSDIETEAGKDQELENSAMMGLYAKAKLPVTSQASLYALLGASAFDMTVVDELQKTTNFKGDQTSASVGVGLQSNVMKSWMVNAELVLYSFKSDSRLAGIELGGAYLF